MRAYLLAALVLLCLTGLSPIAQAQQDLPSARRQLKDLLSRYTERHPDVQRLKELVAKLEAQEKERKAKAPPTPAAAAAPDPRTENLRKVVRKIRESAEALVNQAVKTKVSLPMPAGAKPPAPAAKPAPAPKPPPPPPAAKAAPKALDPDQPVLLQLSEAPSATPAIFQRGSGVRKKGVSREQRAQERARLRELIKKQDAGGR